MIGLILLLIGLLLVLYFTGQFIISLFDGKGKSLTKIWRWISNVIDAISGIG